MVGRLIIMLSCCGMKITDGGFVTTIGGLIIMLGCCGTPQGVNPNDKTVMINPPGRTTTGGVNENLTPAPQLNYSHLLSKVLPLK